METRTRQDLSRLHASGSRGTRASAWLGSLAAVLVAATAAGSLFLIFAPPSYRAEAQVRIGTRPFGLLGLRAHVESADREASALALTKGQAQLVTSRDLARRAIEELGIESWPEFDAEAGGRGPASHLLVLLGLKRDPARMSRPERVLQAYEERLRVSAEPKARLITIAFESEDRELAARAANRIADLYLEMRAETRERSQDVPEARIVSRAVSPSRPVFPQMAWGLVLGLSATFATAVGTFVARRRSRLRLDAVEEPISQQVPLGPAQSFRGPEDSETPALAPQTAGMASRCTTNGAQSVDHLVRRILSSRRGPKGSIVLVTSPSEAAETAGVTLDVARRLGQAARAILVGLDKRQSLDVALASAAERAVRGRDARMGIARMSDLARGLVSFAELIRRDPCSRLHFLAVGGDGRTDLAAAAPVLEALAETYDFVVLAVPPLDREEAATALAPAADLVVLVTPPQPSEVVTRKAEATLIECGARAVTMVGFPRLLRRSIASSLGRDAA